jgi:hypothetical protein
VTAADENATAVHDGRTGIDRDRDLDEEPTVAHRDRDLGEEPTVVHHDQRLDDEEPTAVRRDDAPAEIRRD